MNLQRALIAIVTILSLDARADSPKRHTLEVGGNKVALWEKSPQVVRKTILLLHGRTYSGLPDFDLHVGKTGDYSMMDALVAKGYAVYALDQPGYGGSPLDKSGWFTPAMGVENIVAALRFIKANNPPSQKPVLFGWSLGSTMVLLTAQQHPELISDVALFGFWRNLDVPILEDEVTKKIVARGDKPIREPNTRENAASDFVAPSVVKEVVTAFVDAALKSDPVKVDIRGVEEFGKISPKDIHVPVLLLQGEYDQISSTEKNAKLFTRLGNPDRQWVIIAGGDHAAFLEKTREAFMTALFAFLERPH